MHNLSDPGCHGRFDGEFPAICQEQAIERDFIFAEWREISVGIRLHKMQFGQGNNLRHVSRNHRACRYHRLVKRIDRLHHVPFDRFAHVRNACALIDRDVQRRSFG
jgi:hypothetical protein